MHEIYYEQYKNPFTSPPPSLQIYNPALLEYYYYSWHLRAVQSWCPFCLPLLFNEKDAFYDTKYAHKHTHRESLFLRVCERIYWIWWWAKACQWTTKIFLSVLTLYVQYPWEIFRYCNNWEFRQLMKLCSKISS